MELQLPQHPIPVFPLPGVFLFPHQVLPLHVFEPRYRQMVTDLLDNAGRLVIASTVDGASPAAPLPTSIDPAGFRELGIDVGEAQSTPADVPEPTREEPSGEEPSGKEANGAPPAGLAPVAAFGEIFRHEQLPDGRYAIWVLGLARVQLEEVACDTPYRQARIRPFVEIDVPEPDAEALTQELRDAATARLRQPLPLPDSTPPSLLADLLLQTLQPSPALVERLFAEPDVTARARLTLEEAERAPLPEEPAADGEDLDDDQDDSHDDEIDPWPPME